MYMQLGSNSKNPEYPLAPLPPLFKTSETGTQRSSYEQCFLEYQA